MKKIIFLSVFILFTQLLFAQSENSYVTYAYDNVGNRIARQTVILKNKNKEQNKETSGIRNIFAEGNITVYPNPAKEMLKIQFSGFEIKNDINLRLYDTNGKLITDKKTENYTTQINLSGKPAGTYLLIIVSGKNKKEFTVIKQ